jgi:hypothetical protein
MTARATPAQRQVGTSRGVDLLDATRACPGLKHQRGTDFGQGRITAKTGSVQACLRHDWQFATDTRPSVSCKNALD